MKVAPYHNILPEYGGERDVYHDHGGCPAGRRIKPEHRRAGTDNRPRCKECIDLG
jgi:hypothetical protein